MSQLNNKKKIEKQKNDDDNCELAPTHSHTLFSLMQAHQRVNPVTNALRLLSIRFAFIPLNLSHFSHVSTLSSPPSLCRLNIIITTMCRRMHPIARHHHSQAKNNNVFHSFVAHLYRVLRATIIALSFRVH